MSRPYGSASALEQRRRQAVQAVSPGDKVRDVARIIGVKPRSVYRWLELAELPHGLAAKPHPAPATRLSVAQQQHLEQLLRQGAKSHGWSNDLWTTQRIAELIRRHFGVSLHHDHVGRFLRQRLKWSPQKPRRRARERDEEAIAHWKRDIFPDILEAASARQAHLVFLDESGFMLTPTVRRTWAPRDRRLCSRAGIAATGFRPSVASRSVRNGRDSISISPCCPTTPTPRRRTSSYSYAN